jgi:hypothetical protein
MSTRFVLLELTDPEISGLLLGLRIIFTGKKEQLSNIHLTARGPYSSKISRKLLEKWSQIIANDVLEIGNVGMFSNPDGYIIYLGVYAENLKEIWHKPDYPIKKYGFNPHITLYYGSDLNYAKRILAFLSNENLNFKTHQFQLVEYVSGQKGLIHHHRIADKDFPNLISEGKIKPGILQRAKRAVREYRPATDGKSGLLFID